MTEQKTVPFMRRKGHIVQRFRKEIPSNGEETLLFADNLPRYDVARNADTAIKLIQMNPYNSEILERMPKLGAQECWLVSGCLFQTIWNVIEGRSPSQDILDYDLIYFDPDQSQEAEGAMQNRVRALYHDLDVKIQIRNQARVHLWYQDKFHKPYPELTSALQSLRFYPSRVQAVALQSRGGGRVSFDAPFGFEHILRLTVRPNHALQIPEIYEQKTARWKQIWPNLSVHPWV